MKRPTTSPIPTRKLEAHRSLERKALVLAKKNEAAHQLHRQAKAAYKEAKKAARLAKAAWHRSRVASREARRAVEKSAKRLHRAKGSGAAGAGG